MYPQIALIPNCERESSSCEMIDFVLKDTLRRYETVTAGNRKYIAVDYDNAPDLASEPACDVIMIDRTQSEAEARERIELSRRVNRGSRIFIDKSDSFLKPQDLGGVLKVFTYSLNDPDANFYAQKIRKNPNGEGYLFEVVFQANPSGKAGLLGVILPALNKPVIFPVSISSDNKEDVIHGVKCIAIGSAFNVENKYLNKSISRYDFSSASVKDSLEE